MSNKAIFLDRDDTIVDDPGYISSPEQVKLLPGAVDALKSFKSLGYKLIVVSNQSAIARGIIDEEKLSTIHAKLERILANQGVFLDKIYYCPFHPDGSVEEYSKESELRKPNPGMLLQAGKDFDIDFKESWMIGDSYRDVTAGIAVGCKTILINSPVKPSKKKVDDPTPDYEAVNIKESSNIVRMHNSKKNSSKKNEAPKEEKIQTPEEPPLAAQEIKKENKTQVAKPDITRVNTTRNINKDIYTTSESKKEIAKTNSSTEKLLHEIVTLLKKDDRTQMYNEFSLVKFLAGLLQTGAVFCLLCAVWVMIDGADNEISILTPLAFAAVLQLICLTLHTMDNHK